MLFDELVLFDISSAWNYNSKAAVMILIKFEIIMNSEDNL